MFTVVPAKYRHKLENMLGISIPKGADIRFDSHSIIIEEVEKGSYTSGRTKAVISDKGVGRVSSYKCVTNRGSCVQGDEPVPVDKLTTYTTISISPDKVKRVITWASHQHNFNYFNDDSYFPGVF